MTALLNRLILGVNGIRLLGQRTGVGRMIESLLFWMGELEHPFGEIRVYTPEPLPADIALPTMAQNVVLPSPLPPGLWEQITLPLGHENRQLLLCPSYTAPAWARCPVLLVHHGSYEGYPEAFPVGQRIKARIAYQASARAATLISTVSEYSKRDIVRFYGVKPSKVSVIPDGVNISLFHPVREEHLLAKWRLKYLGADVPFILYVGKPTKRRNLAALLEAFAMLKQGHDLPHKLVLIGVQMAGTPLQAAATRLAVEGSIVALDYASHETIAMAYNASDMLVYPSSYEGFGMPVLEAMACGTPVIALDNTAFPEFAGGIARLLPDAEPDTLCQAIHSGIVDRDWRAHAREAGPVRARNYDWRIVSGHYIALMREMIED